MKLVSTLPLLAAIACSLFTTAHLHAQGTAFTYQGFLTENGGPANGVYDLQLTVFNALAAGSAVGATTTVNDLAITNGLFTVTVSPGTGVFTGPVRWIEIAVRPGASADAYTTVVPRQPILSTPYAVTAVHAITASSAMTVDMGTISDPSFIGTTTTAPLDLFVNNQRGLRLEDNGDGNDPDPDPDGAPNVIGGSSANYTGGGAVGVTIAGGGAANYVGFTVPNFSYADYSVIGGGLQTIIDAGADFSTIAGGTGNRIFSNSPSGTIAGGEGNQIREDAPFATISGGRNNRIGPGATNAFAAGRRAKADHPGVFVWADSQNADFASTTNNQFLIRASGGVGIGTGAPQGDLHIRGTGTNGSMVLTPNVSDSQSQLLLAENQSATLGMILRYAGNEGANPLHIIPLNAGGVEGAPQFTLERFGGNVGIGTNNPVEKLHVIGNILATGTVQGQNLTLAGGVLTLGTTDNQPLQFKVNNEVGLRLEYPTVGSVPNLVGGYSGNSVGAGTEGAVIAGGGAAGGLENSIGINSDYSAIGGGADNTIASNSFYATIAGGSVNDIGVNSAYSAIGGGNNNTIASNSTYATIAGGRSNEIGVNADYSAIGGGLDNNIASNAPYAVIPGGNMNEVGPAARYAFAAGRRAKANHPGAFVWGDGFSGDVASSANNQFTAPAPGVFLAPGQSAWSTISDRTAKKDFAPVDNVAVLEKLARMPVQQWHYDWEEASATPHIGPMAQDFKAAFYPGRDDKSISTMEFDGVALAAIQGLNRKVDTETATLRAENAELKQKNSEMETRLDALEKLMERLSVVQNGGGE